MQENTGLIADPRSTEELLKDYILGVTDKLLKKYRTYDWGAYLPIGRPQSIAENGIFFDTMSCVSFSLNQVVEMQLNYDYRNNELSLPHRMFLENNGYVQNGKIVFSDRFTAIMSGTTKEGNYFQKVADTVSNKDTGVGLIPQSLFPFGGKNFNEYHNRNLITNKMIDLGKEFLKYFQMEYSWVYSDQIPGLSKPEYDLLRPSYQHGPLQIGVPFKATHAILSYQLNENFESNTFDHYIPYNRTPDPRMINFYMSIYITEKDLTTQPRLLKIGMTGQDVKDLQRNLKNLGFYKYPLITGYYGSYTFTAVKNFQLKYGIESTGNYGPITHKKLTELINK